MRLNLVNSIEAEPEDAASRRGGIGLGNVRKRLQLLYKDRHHLEALKMEEVFVVNLDVELEELEAQYEDPLQVPQKGKD